MAPLRARIGLQTQLLAWILTIIGATCLAGHDGADVWRLRACGPLWRARGPKTRRMGCQRMQAYMPLDARLSPTHFSLISGDIRRLCGASNCLVKAESKREHASFRHRFGPRIEGQTWPPGELATLCFVGCVRWASSGEGLEQVEEGGRENGPQARLVCSNIWPDLASQSSDLDTGAPPCGGAGIGGIMPTGAPIFAQFRALVRSNMAASLTDPSFGLRAQVDPPCRLHKGPLQLGPCM